MSKNASSSAYADEAAQGKSPSAEPPQTSGEGGAAASSGGRPSAEPPQSVSASAGAAGASAPSLIPESEGAKSEGITAWQNDKRITGLWTINETRNSWVYITGVGWKKLSNTVDSATVALTMISGSARQTNTPVNYRDEADGMIHEMYVW